MKKLIRISLYASSGLVLVCGLVLIWVLATWERVYDDVPFPNLEASMDPEVIARGQYLVRGPAHCSNCHVGSVEASKQSDAGVEVPMSGGLEMKIGPIAVLYSRNLTPDPETGIGRYSDGQIFRLLRHNVKPDGHASIAPMMPFAEMADADLVAIVSYLRSAEPVRHEVPPSEWTLLGKTILTLLRPAAFQPVLGNSPPQVAPPQEATVERGAYLANNVANCRACHSPIDRVTGELTGPAFSGFSEGEPADNDAKVILRMPNLTPDPTGVLKRFPTEEVWISRFRAGRIIPASFMPWGPFSRMSDEDLRAIYRYLNTLEPVANDVGPTVERIEN